MTETDFHSVTPKLIRRLLIPRRFNGLLINQCLNLQEVIVMHLLEVLFILAGLLEICL
ncbi:MAG: hypothetical protein WB014_10730 [Methanosarcina sp.]